MISDAHRRLREATHDCHQRLEDRANILPRIKQAQGRRSVVEAFHALHAEAEAALTPWLTALDGLDFHGRRRSPRLARDLEALGGAPGPLSPPKVSGVAEALGRMYVLEGSTLGGRVIRKQVEAGGGDMRGLSFLDPYGRQAGPRWQAFLSVVAAHARSEGDVRAMVEGAVAGFRHAETRLCVEAAHV